MNQAVGIRQDAFPIERMEFFVEELRIGVFVFQTFWCSRHKDSDGAAGEENLGCGSGSD